MRTRRLPIAVAVVCLLLCCAASADTQHNPSAKRFQRLDALEALWTSYQFHYIDAGRVVSHDEDGITTSEGQGYAMLRAVWSNDEETFERVWAWTKQNLRVRGDHLFAWKYKDGVIDRNSATDADTDIALAFAFCSAPALSAQHSATNTTDTTPDTHLVRIRTS